jgi:hypothetical protein
LTENFINGIINGQEFRNSFFVVKIKTSEAYYVLVSKINYKKLKYFQSDSRSKDVVNLISFLSAECDNFTEDYYNKQFYDYIKYWFLKLEEYWIKKN